MTPTELIAIAQRGLALRPSPLLRHQANGRHETHEGATFISWGLPGPSFNKVAVFGPAPPLRRILELAAGFFGATPADYGVMVQADAGHPIESELRGQGWTVAEDEAALVLPAIGAAPPLPHGLTVRRATDADGRRDFNHVAAVGFGAPTAEAAVPVPTAAEFDSFGPSLACVLDPDVAVMVGYCDDRPASSAIALRVEDIASVTGVATVPTLRRRGLARALTWAALRAAAARGCTCATLNAAGASFHLYVGMGFIPVGNHRTYAPPAP